MPRDLPKPSGAELSRALSHCKIPHTPLSASQSYTLSEISDNCRANSATFLRCQVPKKSVKEQLEYLCSELPPGDYVVVGTKEKGVGVGLLRKPEGEGELEYRDGEQGILFEATEKQALRGLFNKVEIVYFVCGKFEERHLVRPLLYRKRKAKQLKKAIDKRDAVTKKAGKSAVKKGKKQKKKTSVSK